MKLYWSPGVLTHLHIAPGCVCSPPMEWRSCGRGLSSSMWRLNKIKYLRIPHVIHPPFMYIYRASDTVTLHIRWVKEKDSKSGLPRGGRLFLEPSSYRVKISKLMIYSEESESWSTLLSLFPLLEMSPTLFSSLASKTISLSPQSMAAPSRDFCHWLIPKGVTGWISVCLGGPRESIFF